MFKKSKTAIADFEKLDKKLAKSVTPVTSIEPIPGFTKLLQQRKAELVKVKEENRQLYRRSSTGGRYKFDKNADGEFLADGGDLESLKVEGEPDRLAELERQAEALDVAIKILERKIKLAELEVIRKQMASPAMAGFRKYPQAVTEAFERLEKALTEQNLVTNFLACKGYSGGSMPTAFQAFGIEQTLMLGGGAPVVRLEQHVKNRRAAQEKLGAA